MLFHLTKSPFIFSLVMACLLSNCAQPPYNNFKPPNKLARGAAIGATMGTAIGAATTGTVPGTLAGTAIGGVLGAVLSSGTNPKRSIIKDLNRCDIQFVQYGDTMTLIIPTDKYFMFESPRLNELRSKGLNDIIALLSLYPDSAIYIAGFIDDVGSSHHKNLLTQAQAESMMTFLWANGIPSQRLKTEGYGDKNTIADNALIHGSAMNRRIEIQWFIGKAPQCCFPKARRINYAMK